MGLILAAASSRSALAWQVTSIPKLRPVLKSLPVPLLIVALVFASLYPFPPTTMVLIPHHSGAKTLIQRHRWLPFQLAPDFSGIQGIPAIMSRAVLDMMNETSRLIKDLENPFSHTVVCLLLTRADIVNLTRNSSLKNLK